MTNPFLKEFSGEFGLAPFDQIQDSHFDEAMEKGFAETRENINKIATSDAPPSFENTILALEDANPILDRASAVLFNLTGADTNPARQKLERDLSPKFAQLHSEMVMNQDLFQRVDNLFQNKDDLGLNDEQIRVLTLYHEMFIRSGAALEAAPKERLAQVMQRLAELGTSFSQNLLKDEADWYMEVSEDDLKGCPEFLIEAARAAGTERGLKGAAITLSRSLIVPFLQFSPRRDLREKAFVAWGLRGENDNENNNLDIISETLSLRAERAKLLGFASFADFKLANQMAKTPQAVRDLLMTVWQPAKTKADADAAILTEMMQKDGINGPLQAWDWRYYAEARRKAEFDLDEAELKPYFQLDQMIEASFYCATKLFGLSFREIQAPLYHPDARAWEVTKDGRHMAVFIGDYFARASKRSGAWCSRFRAQSAKHRPHVVNVCNFAKAPKGQPSLLTFDDARTLFHEFGHALHVILSDVEHEFISGTSVARDFVELPSQLYEHWLSVPEILEKFATHAETGEPIPPELLEKLLRAENFDQGFATVEYTSSALVDLAFHTSNDITDPMETQRKTLAEIGMPDAIKMRHATPHFAHVFSGDGYSSGYYSYMWSEVMDADAFEAFEETNDPFDADTASRLLTHIYSAGGSKPADELYKAFRGKMPDVSSLLRGRGLTT